MAIKYYKSAVNLLVTLALTFPLSGNSIAKAQEVPVSEPVTTIYPVKISSDCRSGKALHFDQCSDQWELYKTAQQKAKEENKTLLVIYGAEWCIWTQSLAAHLAGIYGEFTLSYSHPWDEESIISTLYERGEGNSQIKAEELSKFVSNNFVIVYIDSQYASNDSKVLKKSGADIYYSGGIPFVYTVGDNGKFGGFMKSEDVEIRRDDDDWFRGYNRDALIGVLTKMREDAQLKSP